MKPQKSAFRRPRIDFDPGRNPLALDEILRLQTVLIEDTRFTRPGLRPDGVFLGERDHNGDPLPEFVGARPGDLQDLMTGLLAANDRMRSDGLDPVLQAAATAFGFVYVHPLQDGSGRLHRCLIHHVLAERKFTPPGNSCVARTVLHDLPREIDYLRRHDEALRRIMDTVEMPDRVAGNLILFIRQNDGTLSKNRGAGEFQALRDDEVASIEAIIRDAFADY